MTLPLGAAGVWNAFWITECIAAAFSCLMFARYSKTLKTKAGHA